MKEFIFHQTVFYLQQHYDLMLHNNTRYIQSTYKIILGLDFISYKMNLVTGKYLISIPFFFYMMHVHFILNINALYYKKMINMCQKSTLYNCIDVSSKLPVYITLYNMYLPYITRIQFIWSTQS